MQESNLANFVLSEFGLRERKKKNVIVYGVSESKSSKVEEQRSDDKKAIQQIFTAIGVKDKDVVTYRRFKKTSDRVPPILITMKVSAAAVKKLRNSPSHCRVYLNPDMTETERREGRNLREIRKSRPSASSKGTTNAPANDTRSKSATNEPATDIGANGMEVSEPIESGRVSGHFEEECNKLLHSYQDQQTQRPRGHEREHQLEQQQQLQHQHEQQRAQLHQDLHQQEHLLGHQHNNQLLSAAFAKIITTCIKHQNINQITT